MQQVWRDGQTEGESEVGYRDAKKSKNTVFKDFGIFECLVLEDIQLILSSAPYKIVQYEQK